jgi:glucose dehydrogenase
MLTSGMLTSGLRTSGATRRQPALIVGLLMASFAWALVHAAAGRAGGDTAWPRYGLDEWGTHYSPLDQIDAANVARLGLAWSTDLDAFAGQIEGTPLMVDGTIYATRPWSVVFAIDARTGRLKWRWDPQIPHQTFVTDARGRRTRIGPASAAVPSIAASPTTTARSSSARSTAVSSRSMRAPAVRCGRRRWRARRMITASRARLESSRDG